jgi:hypothetical protein
MQAWGDVVLEHSNDVAKAVDAINPSVFAEGDEHLGERASESLMPRARV